ncbi:MAG: serine/threonine protein kinase, partial [Planctomycetes bacterium]|nr:serine/threonine protein kinase [Planctomycetota bacterium]
MTPSDPDDSPTRHSGGLPERPQQPGAESGDDKTRPAGDAKPPQPPAAKPPTTPPAKPGAKAGKPAGAADPMVGKVLGGCRLDRLLGRGAMGAVYQARQLKLDRDVAVKVIRAEMMSDPRTLKRFQTEARIVGRFQSANVVMVHDVGFESGVHFLVMELVQGKNLRDHVKLLAGGRLPAGEALPLLRQAILGLEEAQRLQVVHRDIKPDNLMLTDRAVLKIADFGIAKPLQEDFSLTLTSELVGTPLYMSPEQCRGQAEIDFRSDMYSLGATFYYLLTGEPPIRASSVYELIQTKTKLANLCLWKALPGLDENNPLSRVIERMTALDPNDRYQSYEALRNDLVLVEQGGTVHVPKPGTGGLPQQRRGRSAGKPMLFGAAAVLALGIGGYAWYATRPASAPTGGGGANPGVAVDADAAARAAAEQLPALRQRLQREGPSPALREQLQALPVRGEALAVRDRLLADHAAGAALATQLAALSPPAELVPPFAALRAHVSAVDALLPLPGTPGPEVAAWAQQAVAAARGDRELLPAATARLTAAMVQWQRDRDQQAGDDKTLVELGQRLEAIEAGRSTLLELWPAARAALQADLPVALLEAARQQLVAPARPADVDAGPALAEIRAEFVRSGPSAALGERTRSLQPNRPEQLQQRDQLLNDLQRAEAARGLAQAARAQDFPATPKLPFDDVDGYWQKVDRALQPLRAADGALPDWAVALRAELRDEPALQPLLVGACRTAFAQRPRGGAGAEAAVAAIEQAVARVRQWFPAAAAELAAAVPSDALQAARTELQQAGLAQSFRTDADALGQRLAALSTVADWQRSAARCRTELAALGERAAPLSADAEVGAQLSRLRGQCERWTAVEQRLRDCDQKLGAGELGAAESLLAGGVVGDEGRAELLLAGELAAACRAAFVRL